VHTESERFGTGKILHFGNIRARNESFARAGNDKAAKLRIMCDFGHFFIKAVKKRGIQRIECLGTVDGENADIAGFFIKKHEKKSSSASVFLFNCNYTPFEGKIKCFLNKYIIIVRSSAEFKQNKAEQPQRCCKPSGPLMQDRREFILPALPMPPALW